MEGMKELETIMQEIAEEDMVVEEYEEVWVEY